MQNDYTPVPPQIEDEAAAWAARLDRGPLTRSESAELQAWLDAHVAHESCLSTYLSLNARAKTEVPKLVKAGILEVPDEGARAPVWTQPRRSWLVAASLVLAAAAVSGGALFRGLSVRRLATPQGKRDSVALEDGTQVELNARTLLDFRLQGGERRAHLEQGEAFFSVASDMTRPFVVQTRAGSVRVTGTAFNVRVDAPGRLEVTVVHGSVEVTPDGSTSYVLAPNEQFALNGTIMGRRSLRESETAAVIAWREGRVLAEGMPLSSALERMAYYHNRELRADPAVAHLRLGGSFRLDDLDGFLRDVQQALPVLVLRGGEVIRLVSR
ncbi:MAG: FecR domain-containing protein [Opitutaceae bacterium]